MSKEKDEMTHTPFGQPLTDESIPKAGELNGGVAPSITVEKVRDVEYQFCEHKVNLDLDHCLICEKAAEKSSDKQLALPTREPVVATPKKKTMTEEQKIDIIRQGLDYVTGFKGNLWKYELKKSKTYFLQGDGLWLVVDRTFATMVSKVNDNKFPGEYNVLSRSFLLKLPKMPGSILTQILAFFRHYVVDEGITSVTEAMTQVYWDPIDKQYFVNIPKQEVNGAHVTYTFDEQDPRIKSHGCVKVWDIHSHNTMSSFFSGVDDGDEQGQQFYGVIGNITKDTHTWAFRMGTDGLFSSIDEEALNALVDMSSFQEQGTYPKEWEKKVSIDDWKTKMAKTGGAAEHYDYGVGGGRFPGYGGFGGYGGYGGHDDYDYHHSSKDSRPWYEREGVGPRGGGHGSGSGFGIGGNTDWKSWNKQLLRQTIDEVCKDLKDGSDIRYFVKKMFESPQLQMYLDHIRLQEKVHARHSKGHKKGKG